MDKYIESLKCGSPSERKDAARLLGRMGYEWAVVPLIQALRDPDDGVRFFVASALGDIAARCNVKYALQALKNQQESVRRKLVEAVEPLIRVLKDDKDEVRSRAAWALGEIGDSRAVEPLIDVVYCGGDFDRISAVGALGKIGDERAVEALTWALNCDWSFDDSRGDDWYGEKMREVAGWSLKQIKGSKEEESDSWVNDW